MNTAIQNVPAFTADDFYNSSNPYDWLWQFQGDKFLMGQMREKLKSYAAKVGVRGFIGLWNSYLETVHAQRGVKIDNATMFDGQPVELFCGPYVCDETGVVFYDKAGYEQMVCRHPILPVQRLVNIDSGEERLEIAFRKGRSWRSIVVEKAVLASSHQILQLAANGVMVNSETAKSLSTYLFDLEQLNYEDIPEQRSVGRLGWVGDHGFAPYVDGIVFDGEANFRHIFNAVHEAGGRSKWIEAVKKVRAEKSVGRIFLAASFASAMLAPCGLLPFFVHAWGGTEVGKTVGLMLAASVWANPKLGEYISTFNSTAVGQEMVASFLNSLPMCVDELQIQSSSGLHDFDKMIYQLTEGVGRTRGAKHGGLQKNNTWKNCIITNGEHPISNVNSGGGAVNRIIEFECVHKVYSDLVGLCAVLASNYGFAGKEFVRYLQQPGAVERANEIQKDFYEKLLNCDSTEKQAASASALLAADQIATELIFKDDCALTVEDIAEIMTKKDDVDANVRALEYVKELVERNIVHFKPGADGEYHSEVWGKIDGRKVYIIKTVFDQQMSLAGFNGTAFLAWAKRKGVTICDKDKRTKNARILNGVVVTVCVDLQEKTLLDGAVECEEAMPF